MTKWRLELIFLKDPWIYCYAGTMEETYRPRIWSRPPTGIGVNWYDTTTDCWEWLP